MSCDGHPELSVIVPVFNEEKNLEALFDSLSAQRSVRLQLIVSDGGSADGTRTRAAELGGAAAFPVRIIQGEKGRGAQMNRAVPEATAPILLFLHADSSFGDSLALGKALDSFRGALAGRHDDRIAGRFPLRFAFAGRSPLPFRYYEQKARLDRPGCTHGDQGFLLTRRFFEEIGPFDEKLPLMEDTTLAERIRRRGSWLLFPSPIVTSPRRFEKEGLRPRQTLNAVLMNLAAQGRLELLGDARVSYRSHDAAGRLRLREFFLPLCRRIAGLPLRERLSFWYRTGSYVRDNAWQLAFFLDVLCQGKRDGANGRFLRGYDRFLGRVTENSAGRGVAALLVWGWFRLAVLTLRAWK